MKYFNPKKIYISNDAKDLPLTQKILSRLPEVPVELTDHPSDIFQKIKKNPDPWVEGKSTLFLSRDQGKAFKPFPESEQYFSCDYYSLHLAEGCDMECSYCILQSYLTNPLLMIYVNIEEILENLETFLNAHPEKFFRFGTGHLSDSLSLDHITGFSEILIPFFARQDNAVLELKTKSDNIDRLLDLDPRGKTIVSWSVNTQKIQKEEEHKCASLAERIESAQKISSTQDYRVGFHLDPLIDYPECEKDYEETISNIAKEIDPKKIAWISIGSLRMMPDLKKKIQTRFPNSKIAEAEWIKGMDGKLRYFKLRRIELYQNITALIKKYLPSVTIYLIMESPEVWERVFGKEFTKPEICEMLDLAGKASL